MSKKHLNSTPHTKAREIINRNVIQQSMYAKDMTQMLGLFNKDLEAANKKNVTISKSDHLK